MTWLLADCLPPCWPLTILFLLTAAFAISVLAVVVRVVVGLIDPRPIERKSVTRWALVSVAIGVVWLAYALFIEEVWSLVG